MGSTESTGRSNRSEEEERDEEARQPGNSSSGGGSMGTGTAVAVATAGTVMAAWGISKMISSSSEEEERDEEARQPGGGSMGAGTAVAIGAAGTVMAAWGISKMTSTSSDSESSEEEDDAMKMKAHGIYESKHLKGKTIWSPPPPPGRFKMNTDGGCPRKIIEGNAVEQGLAGYAGIDESIQLEAKRNTPKTIWSPPPLGRFKMNTDGVCYGIKQSDGVERGPSGFGGILRNDRGEWVRGFQGFVASTDILTAEIYGIYYGLKLLDKPEYRGSILESDSEQAVKWINPPKPKDNDRGKSRIIHGCWGIIMESRQLAHQNDIDVVHKVGEDANQCADKMADIAVKTQEAYMEIKYLPSEIRHLYNKDKKFLNC